MYQNNQLNAIAAIRVSTTRQGAEGDSPEAQKEQIESERYFQIEFNFDITTTKPDDIANKYQEISAMIKSFKVEVFNQFNPSYTIKD